MGIVVGRLSTLGWATTLKEKFNAVMDNYTESGYSQSVLYRGNVKSYAHALAMYSQDPESLAFQVQSDLLSLYKSVFPYGAEVEVVAQADGDETSIRYKIVISVRVRETPDGQWYDASSYIEVKGED
ncbi:MAG: hypothetical protein ACRDBQ_18505 [Shewanella sp.]